MNDRQWREKMQQNGYGMSRRDLLKAGIALGGAALIGPWALDPVKALACGVGGEPVPTSPFILSPFTDPLPIPQPLGTSDPTTWVDPKNPNVHIPPGPGAGQQDCDGGTHQVWTSALGLPDPLFYRIRLLFRPHSFTSSQVQPIDANGSNVIPPDGIPGPRSLPDSGIYGFNGTFPGPMINAEYGRPVLVRFENHLKPNPFRLPRQDFGAPDLAFLTHLHNGHTAPESDGQPHYKPSGYQPDEWVDNLYLNYPAGGDDTEKQSFFWFHDHRMDFTGANVYKGMVGLFPIYDPVLDSGDETKGLRLPGVRRNLSRGRFRVDYDVPLAFFDCVFDDGVTPHRDAHIRNSECGKTHPEWWGMSFFRHYPNHGFVGDVFTVNGKAYPFMEVKRRKYRFRFLDASIARIYEFKLMRSINGPVASPGTQGQWLLSDGQQCMQFVQVAAEGGLLPAPITRDSFQLWPAKRREVIVDFTKYMDGSPVNAGDEIYLVNICKMSNGRKPDSPDKDYIVPVLKFIAGDTAPDNSLIPTGKLRDLPALPSQTVLDAMIQNRRVFTLSRGKGGNNENQWLINGLPFDPLVSLADMKRGVPEVWEINNGGGGWVHPLHIHMEEHQVLERDGKPAPDSAHPDDKSREDVVALEPSESVLIYRNFRTFTGKYVCHCHNLAHEDHAMMFGWTIQP